MHMHKCILCSDVITNPVCVQCLEREIKTWLLEVEPEIIPEFERIVDSVDLRMGDTTCILCHQNFSVCNFCFITEVANWLENYPYLINRFRRFFNPYT